MDSPIDLQQAARVNIILSEYVLDKIMKKLKTVLFILCISQQVLLSFATCKKERSSQIFYLNQVMVLALGLALDC